MAITKKVKVQTLIPLLNNLAFLLRWLRPGKVALKVARIKTAFEEPTLSYNAQREALLEELVITEMIGEGDARRRVRRQRPHDTMPGVMVWDAGPRQGELEKRDKEMRDMEVEVTFTPLSMADIEKIEKSERIQRPPTDKDGETEQIVSVDFSILLPVIELDEESAPATKEEPAPAHD